MRTNTLVFYWCTLSHINTSVPVLKQCYVTINSFNNHQLIETYLSIFRHLCSQYIVTDSPFHPLFPCASITLWPPCKSLSFYSSTQPTVSFIVFSKLFAPCSFLFFLIIILNFLGSPVLPHCTFPWLFTRKTRKIKS